MLIFYPGSTEIIFNDVYLGEKKKRKKRKEELVVMN